MENAVQSAGNVYRIGANTVVRFENEKQDANQATVLMIERAFEEIAEVRRRISVLEQDAEGERTVSRHTLRKVNDVEGAVLDLTKAVANLTKNVADLAKTVGQVEDHIVVSQAEPPRKLADMVAAVVREERVKRK